MILARWESCIWGYIHLNLQPNLISKQHISISRSYTNNTIYYFRRIRSCLANSSYILQLYDLYTPFVIKEWVFMTDASVNFFWKKWCFKLFSHCCLSTVPSPGAPLMSKTFLCLKLCRQMSNSPQLGHCVSPHTRNSVKTGDEMQTDWSFLLPSNY